MLASPEWFELACKLLAEVARECGEDGFERGVLRELSDEETRGAAEKPRPIRGLNLIQANQGETLT